MGHIEQQYLKEFEQGSALLSYHLQEDIKVASICCLTVGSAERERHEV